MCHMHDIEHLCPLDPLLSSLVNNVSSPPGTEMDILRPDAVRPDITHSDAGPIT
jgi:hypothetical protein